MVETAELLRNCEKEPTGQSTSCKDARELAAIGTLEPIVTVVLRCDAHATLHALVNSQKPFACDDRASSTHALGAHDASGSTNVMQSRAPQSRPLPRDLLRRERSALLATPDGSHYLTVMSDVLPFNEPAVRMGAFATVLIMMIVWEMAAPRRRLGVPRGERWLSNFAIVALDVAVVRLLFPIAAVGAALVAETYGWGVFRVLDAPAWLAVIGSLIVLDLAIWAQHVVFHRIPVLWRLHRMHHSDVDIDVTTALRFHPIEIALSMLIKMTVVVLLGAPAVAVVLFEVILNGMAMFNHGNVCLPAPLDRALRAAVVTPDFHRVHHSVHPEETNSNYGFNLSIWDRLFGTYRAQPRDGHEAMTIGLDRFRASRDRRLDRVLLQPFGRA